MGKTNSIVDKEWEEILKSMNIRYPIKNTGNFIEDYFNTMRMYIKKIRNTTYFQTLNHEDEKELKSNLYNLGGMFVCFWTNVNNYRNKYDETIDFQYKETKNTFLPGGHNYNAFLSKYYKMTPNLFENFYSKYIDSIEEFVNNKGKLPKYLYNIIKSDNYYFVQKLQLFRLEDVPQKLKEKHKYLSLPNYYQINGKLGEREVYEKMFKNDKTTCYRDAFFDNEYPILEWINHNIYEDTPITKEEKFLRRYLEDDKKAILHFLAHKEKDEEIVPYEIYQYAAIKEEDIIKILEELIEDREFCSKKIYKKDGKYYHFCDILWKKENDSNKVYC